MSLPTATATDTTGPDYGWSKIYNYDDYSFGSSTDVLTVTASDDAGNSSTSQVINISKSDTRIQLLLPFQPVLQPFSWRQATKLNQLHLPLKIMSG